MYILSNHSKGISSLQLSIWLGVTPKTAWFLNHRIRVMLAEKAPKVSRGVVEVDETYVGGKISNKHVSKRKELGKFDNKTIVFGAVEREGRIVTKVVPDTKVETLENAVNDSVQKGEIMVSEYCGPNRYERFVITLGMAKKKTMKTGIGICQI